METDNFSAALAFPRGIIVGRLLRRRPYRFSFFAHSLAAAHGTGHTGVGSSGETVNTALETAEEKTSAVTQEVKRNRHIIVSSRNKRRARVLLYSLALISPEWKHEVRSGCSRHRGSVFPLDSFPMADENGAFRGTNLDSDMSLLNYNYMEQLIFTS